MIKNVIFNATKSRLLNVKLGLDKWHETFAIIMKISKVILMQLGTVSGWIYFYDFKICLQSLTFLNFCD